MITTGAFFKQYRLASLLTLEGALALISIARSVITSRAPQETAAKSAALQVPKK